MKFSFLFPFYFSRKSDLSQVIDYLHVARANELEFIETYGSVEPHINYVPLNEDQKILKYVHNSLSHMDPINNSRIQAELSLLQSFKFPFTLLYPSRSYINVRLESLCKLKETIDEESY